jgi:hypothetical protein
MGLEFRENKHLLDDKNFRDKLEQLGYGLCDHCLSIHKIGRGDNFYWFEKTSSYYCISCENEMPKGLEAI